MKLRTPVGISALTRTAMGKHGGTLAAWLPYEMMGRVIHSVAERTTKKVDEVIVGSIRSHIGNVGRVGALEAGLEMSVPATTVDRQCASSMEALAIAAAKVGSGLGERYIVGGVESASRGPWFLDKTARPFAYGEPQPYTPHMSTPEVGDPSMGETAEILADEFDIKREEMDEFSLESHKRAAAATKEGVFADEILPLPPRGKQKEAFAADETIREDTTLEKLAKLPPAFRKDGRVTAAGSSPLTDGASGAFVADLETFEKDGLKPDAKVLGFSTVALDPKRMGMGPALAIPALLEAHGLKQSDIDLFEINEAFAAQILAANKELKIPADVLNVHGGAIALGHPFGATGVRLIVTLVNALKKKGLKRGVASLCVGGGQGMATLVETL